MGNDVRDFIIICKMAGRGLHYYFVVELGNRCLGLHHYLDDSGDFIMILGDGGKLCVELHYYLDDGGDFIMILGNGSK